MDAREVLQQLEKESRQHRSAVEAFVEAQVVSYLFSRSVFGQQDKKASAPSQASSSDFAKCIAAALNLKNDKDAADVLTHFTQVKGQEAAIPSMGALERVCVFYYEQRQYCWLILQELLRVADKDNITAEYHETVKTKLSSAGQGGKALSAGLLLAHISNLYEHCNEAVHQAKTGKDKFWEALLPASALTIGAATSLSTSSALSATNLHEVVSKKMVDFAEPRRVMALEELEQTLKTLVLFLRAGLPISSSDVTDLISLCSTHKFTNLLRSKRSDDDNKVAYTQVCFQFLIVFSQILQSPIDKNPFILEQVDVASEEGLAGRIRYLARSAEGGNSLIWQLIEFVSDMSLDFFYYVSHPQSHISFEGNVMGKHAVAVHSSLAKFYPQHSQTWQPLAGANGRSSHILAFLDSLIDVGLAEKQNDADKLMLGTYENVMRDVLSKIIFQNTNSGPYATVPFGCIISLVEKLYKSPSEFSNGPESNQRQGPDAFWQEWMRHEDEENLQNLETIRPTELYYSINADTAGGGSGIVADARNKIEYNRETPLCVYVRIFQEYSVKFWGLQPSSSIDVPLHDEGGFPRLLAALAPASLGAVGNGSNRESFDCLLRMLNREVPLRSVLLEQDLQHCSTPFDGRYRLRHPFQPAPFQFGSLASAASSFLLPDFGEIVNIYQVEASALRSLFPAAQDENHVIYDIDIEDSLSQRGLSTNDLGLVQEMIQIVNSHEDKGMGYVDRRALTFGTLVRYSQHQFLNHTSSGFVCAGFADPSVSNLAWRQQAQQQLRLLLGQKYEVQWNKTVCWWKLILEAIANPHCEQQHILERKTSALKLVASLLQTDKVETLLELQKQWQDVQLYSLLQDFFHTPPNDVYATFLGSVFSKLREQVLPTEYQDLLQRLSGIEEERDKLWQWQRCSQGITAEVIIAIGQRLLVKHQETFAARPLPDSPDPYKSYIEVSLEDYQINQELVLMESQVQGKNLERRSAVILCIHAAQVAQSRLPTYYNSNTACCDALCKSVINTVASIVPLFISNEATIHQHQLLPFELSSRKAFLAALELLSNLSECPSPWSEAVSLHCNDRFVNSTQDSIHGSGFASTMMQLLRYEANRQSHHITLQVCRLFSSSLISMEQSAATVELKSLFEEVDVDKSGDISREELSGLLQRRGYSFPPSTIDELFKQIENPLTCGITYSALFQYAMSPAGLGGNISIANMSISEGGGEGGTSSYHRSHGGLTELRVLLQKMTTSAAGSIGDSSVLSCNFAVSMMDYCVRIFVSHSSWEFTDRCQRWEMSLSCLTSMHTALERIVRSKELSGRLVETSPTSQVAHFLLHKAATDGGQLIAAIAQAASLMGLSAASGPVMLPLDFRQNGLVSTVSEFELGIIIRLGTVALRTLSVLIENGVGGDRKELLHQLGYVLCTSSAVVPPGLSQLPASVSFGSALEGNYLSLLAGMLDFTAPSTLIRETLELHVEILQLIAKVMQCTPSFRLSLTTNEGDSSSLLDIIGAPNVPGFMGSLSSFLRDFLQNSLKDADASTDRVTAMLDLLLVTGSTQPAVFATLLACQAAEDAKGLHEGSKHYRAASDDISRAGAYDAKLVLEIMKHSPEDSEFLKILLQGIKSIGDVYETHPVVLHKLLSLVRLIWDKSSNLYLAKASLHIALSAGFWTAVSRPLDENIDDVQKVQPVDLLTMLKSTEQEWERLTTTNISPFLEVASVDPAAILESDFFAFHRTIDFLRSKQVSSGTFRELSHKAYLHSKGVEKKCHMLLVHAASLDLFTREARGVFSSCLDLLLQHGHGDEDKLRGIHRETTKAVKLSESSMKKDQVRSKHDVETCTELVRVLDEIPAKIEKETHAFLQKAHTAPPGSRSRFKSWLKSYLNAEIDEKLIDSITEYAADMGVNLRLFLRNRPLPSCDAHFGLDHEYLTDSIQSTTSALLNALILSNDAFPDGRYDRIRKPWSFNPEESDGALAIPSLEADLEKYNRWCDLSLKMTSLNCMWSVSNAKGYLLRAAKRFFSTHVGEKPQPQRRSLLKKSIPDVSKQGRSGSEEIRSPATPQTPSLAAYNAFSPGGGQSGLGTPSGLSTQPSMRPGDIRSYELVNSLIDQFNEMIIPIEKRRSKSFMSVDIQNLSDLGSKGKGRNALLSIEKYDLLLAMLSLQLQSVVSRSADPAEAVIADRESFEMRMSPAAIVENLQKLSALYEAQLEALDRSDPTDLVCSPITFASSHTGDNDDGDNDNADITAVDILTGRALTLHDPDIRRAVKLPLLTCMLLLLNRLASDRKAGSDEMRTTVTHANSPRGEVLQSEASYHRVHIFHFALKTIREETSHGWTQALVGAGSGGVRNPTSAKIISSSTEQSRELPCTFIRCVDGVCLRPGARRAPLVQVSLRLLKAALPKSTASSEENDQWVSALDGNSGVLVGILRELCASKDICEYVKLEHDYSRWADKTRTGLASTDVSNTTDDNAEVPARTSDSSAAPKRSSEVLNPAPSIHAQPVLSADPADMLAALKDVLDVMLAAVCLGGGGNAAICEHLVRGGGLIRELTKASIFRTLRDTLMAQGGAKPSVLMGYSARWGEASLVVECWERVLHIITEVVRKLPAVRGGMRGGSNSSAEDDVLGDVMSFVTTYADLLVLPMHVTDSRFSLRQLEMTRTTMLLISELSIHTQWQSSCPNVYKTFEERASFMVKKSSVALHGGADHKDLNSVSHQRHLKRYILAVSGEERGQQGPSTSSKSWLKFKRDFSHIKELPLYPNRQAGTPKTPSSKGGPNVTFNLFSPSPVEKLDFNPQSVVKPKTPEPFQAAVGQGGGGGAVVQQKTAAEQEEEDRPRKHLAFLLVKFELSLLAAVVPIASFLVQATPDPFGVAFSGTASAVGTKLDGYTFAKEKLMVGTTCFYRKTLINAVGLAEEHPHLYQGTITHIHHPNSHQPQDPYILELVLANGQRDGADGSVTSNHVVYLQRPLMNYMSMYEIARDNAGFQQEEAESAMVLDDAEQHSASAAMGMERSIIGDAGARRELALGAATAHLLVILKFVTNESVNKRLIPERVGGKQGEKRKVCRPGHGDAASNIILDLHKLFGELAWLLFANCKHHLLAMQKDAQLRDGIVSQLDELKELLRNGETLYGHDSENDGHSTGYLSFWFRLDTIKTYASLQQFKPLVGTDDEEVYADYLRLQDWEAYRAWLLNVINGCKDTLLPGGLEGQVTRDHSMVAPARSITKRRKGMEVETI